MNAELKIFVLVSCFLFFITAIFIILIFINIYKRKQKIKQENEKQQQQFSQTLLQTQIEIQEQTLNTISQEIHDNIGQILSLTKLTLGNINPNNVAEVTQKLNTAKTLVNKAVVDLKDLSNSLNNDKANQIGLIKSIENQIEIINKNKLQATLNVDGNAVKLDPKIEIILFRIVQECLQNVVKHAQATTVNIAMIYNNNTCTINIIDNGKGFNTNDTFNKGIGLKNIENRIQLINGKFNVQSNYSGTAVQIIVGF